MFPPLNEQLDLLLRGAAEIIPEEELEKKLARAIKHKKHLIVKEGFDPSAPDLHLGHTVSIRKLKDFQDLGHTVIFVIGDFTGLVGDPTGRNVMRPRMTRAEINANAETYKEQVFKILNPTKTIIRFNSEWSAKLDVYQILELTAHHTVARMLERNDFEKRYREGKPIAILEFLYPLFQSYDSVVLKSDVELGGSDQKFNLLLGRQLQQEFGQEGQVAFMMPLLMGTDGKEKMSKSLGNYIGINEPPEEIFGKTMSIPDELIYPYFELTTGFSLADLTDIKAHLEDKKTNPRDLKQKLAFELVKMYHSTSAAESARLDFERKFVDKAIPDDIPNRNFPPGEISLGKLLHQAGLTGSIAEGKRLIAQGGVKIDGEKVENPLSSININRNMVIQVGKRKFVRIIPKNAGQ
jgi:tyrosyl-tRNA synthetase